MSLISTLTYEHWKKRQAWDTDTSWWTISGSSSGNLRFCVGTSSNHNYVGKFCFQMPTPDTGECLDYAILAIDTTTTDASVPYGIIGKLSTDNYDDPLDGAGCVLPKNVRSLTGLSTSYVYSDEACTSRITTSIQHGDLVYCKFDISNCTPGSTYAFYFIQSTAGTGSIWGDTTAASEDTIKIYTKKNTVTLSLNKGTGVASFTQTGTGTYSLGATATTTATASTGYHLTKYTGTLADGSSNGEWTDCAGQTTHTNNWTMNATRTITAHAAINTYTVTYSPGASGSGDIQTQQTTHGAAVTLQGALFTRTGYTQVGWSTMDDGSSDYSLSAIIPQGSGFTSNITLYPVWESKSTVSTRVDGSFISGVPYIKVSGTYVRADEVYIKVDGVWKLSKQ